jgi:hypothetical protein
MDKQMVPVRIIQVRGKKRKDEKKKKKLKRREERKPKETPTEPARLRRSSVGAAAPAGPPATAA